MSIVLVTHDVDIVSNRISHVACLNQTIHFMAIKMTLTLFHNKR